MVRGSHGLRTRNSTGGCAGVIGPGVYNLAGSGSDAGVLAFVLHLET
jgi:hypothetical protein